MTIKNKLRAGIGFLFLLAFISAGMAGYYLNKLADDSKDILKDNYRSIIYTKNINQTLDKPGALTAADLKLIGNNIAGEAHNITEPGEQQLADSLRSTFERFKLVINDTPAASALKTKMKADMYSIMQLNMSAMEHKNNTAANTANSAILIVSLLGSLLFLIAFSFAVNFPGYIANPVRELIEGIKEIANKNYNKRLQVTANNEFGDVAQAFNQMAAKLHDYDTSNLASILFEKKRIETIINSMYDAIIGLDDKQVIIFANKVACSLIGLTEDKLTGQYAPNIALENDLLRNILVTDHQKMKIYADERESYFTKETLDVVNDNMIIGRVIILKNITDFQQLNDAKTSFIATISHELKTPLSAIKMSLKLLEDDRVGTINTEQKQLLQNIEDDAQRLLQITGELLNVAQVETGKIDLHFGSTHPQNIVDYAVRSVRSLADQKQLTIAVNCPANLPNVTADLDKSTWVLINLLSNAIKYGPSRSTIELAVKKQPHNLIEFSVKDVGPGIDPQYVSRIFERYFKVPGADPEKTGTGLGLAIAKDFIEAQGGTIGVDSEIGDGSRFYFSLVINSA